MYDNIAFGILIDETVGTGKIANQAFYPYATVVDLMHKAYESGRKAIPQDKILIDKHEYQRYKAAYVSLDAYHNITRVCPICGKAVLVDGLVCPHCGYDDSEHM